MSFYGENRERGRGGTSNTRGRGNESGRGTRGYRGRGVEGGRGTRGYGSRGRGDSYGGKSSYYQQNPSRQGDGSKSIDKKNNAEQDSAIVSSSSLADKKFDALFGGFGAPPSESSKAEDKFSALVDDAIITTNLKAEPSSHQDRARKVSGVASRKESLVSAEPQESAPMPIRTHPRKRYTKDEMLKRFKKTSTVDFSVFEKQSLIDKIEMFITSEKSSEESKNPKDELLESLEPEEEEAEKIEGGQLPESLKSTVNAPEHGLQQFPGRGGPYRPQGAKPKGSWSKGESVNKGKDFYGSLEEEDDEDEPEWVDFDPKKDKDAFLGREIPQEDTQREAFQVQKERFQRGKPRHDPENEDKLDEMILESIKHQLKDEAVNTATQFDNETGGYSDIDLIYAKKQNSLQEKEQNDAVVEDDQLDDLFESMMQNATESHQDDVKEEEEEEAKANQAVLEEAQDPEEEMEIDQKLKDQITDLASQQKEQLEATKLQEPEKPQFSALQNLQKMFQYFPVVKNETQQVKLEEIGKFEVDEKPDENGKSNTSDLFTKLMSAFNPFAQYVIKEMLEPDSAEEKEESTEKEGAESKEGQTQKYWELEETIFKKPQGEQVKKENLMKTSSEMFVIYKYLNDPMMRVKSHKYTKGEFVIVKDLFNAADSSLFESTSLSNQQIAQQQQQMMMRMVQQPVGAPGAPMPPAMPMHMPMGMYGRPGMPMPSAAFNPQHFTTSAQSFTPARGPVAAPAPGQPAPFSAAPAPAPSTEQVQQPVPQAQPNAPASDSSLAALDAQLKSMLGVGK